MPKVLRQANGKSLISYVLENLDFIQKKDTIVVVGYKGDMVKKELGDAYSYALQQEQLGTGHAVAQAKGLFSRGEPTSVLVTYGDMPLFRRETYQRLCQIHKETGAGVHHFNRYGQRKIGLWQNHSKRRRNRRYRRRKGLHAGAKRDSGAECRRVCV